MSAAEHRNDDYDVKYAVWRVDLVKLRQWIDHETINIPMPSGRGASHYDVSLRGQTQSGTETR